MSAIWDHNPSVVTPHENLLGLVHPGREVRRTAKVWMKFLNQIAMGASNVGGRRALFEPENFVGFIFRNRARSTRVLARLESPRVRVRIACRTPAGKAAVEISL